MAFTLDSVQALGPVLGSVIVWFLFIGITLGFFGLVAYWLYMERQYKYKALVMQVDSGSEYDNVRKTIIVRARKNIKKGYFKLKKFKQELSIPSSEFWQKIGNSEGVYYQWDGREMFMPLRPTVNSPVSFTPGKYDIVDEMVNRKLNSAKRHLTQKHWEKYGQYYIIIGVTLIMVVGMYMMGNDISNGLNSVGSGLNALAHNSNIVDSGVQVIG